ncbi:NACHT, LRR and PYD domains-containing protein 3-like isoform X2 [Hydra vulgaris]|uniref:NACHT, LRR and PYD domains-containing protein 3-like isoform X2 n=1 Tax=Hydra vulgaris TaxID=6087 RepID=A0ABM4B402_HYDVU
MSLYSSEGASNKGNDDQFLLTSKIVGRVGHFIGGKFDSFGRHLNLSQYDVSNIKTDEKTAQAKAVAVIDMWIERNGISKWEQLKIELLSFGHKSTVEIIEKEFLLNNLSMMSAELKKFYLEYYGEISELQPPLQASSNVDLMHKFVDLCIVDAVKTQKDAVSKGFSVERKEFLEKQVRFTSIPFREVFMNEKSVILLSGIAGIGKTWLLKKCLLEWSNDLIWKNVELVFYLECRRINECENVSNINELLSVFYKDIISNFNISIHTNSALFVIDGLDEFKFFNELSNSELKSNSPIVNVLAEIRNYNHLVAGRVYAIDQYQNKYTDRNDKLTVQIMGFNEYGITNYVENHVTEEYKEIVKATLKESPIAKAMASIPFYLSSMCIIISDSKTRSTNSFLTMTDLYANIFLYFFRKHIIKNNKTIYQIMEDNLNKIYVSNICKIAFELLVQNKVIFSKNEFQTFVNDLDKNEGNFFGFIEKIETDWGCFYQFAHLTIMEFCASVYAYNCLSCDEIMANEKLKSCLPMICGLTNKSQDTLLQFLVNLSPSENPCKLSILLSSILDRPFEKTFSYEFLYECFYESQTSFTDEIKSIFDKRDYWPISIYNSKTSYAISCDNHILNYCLKSGIKLKLSVDKNILSDKEKKLLIRCSTNVRIVLLCPPINFEGWKPKDKIEELDIWTPRYLITKKNKKDFEENFLPWINLCEELRLTLCDDIDFFKDICEWVRCSNIKKFKIWYRGKVFRNVDELTF